MPLHSYKEILQYAKEHNFTVPAFNSYNMESMQGQIFAAEKKNVPLIVQTYHIHMAYAGSDCLAAICKATAKNANIMVALGLDHGQTFEQAKKCIDSGYSAVMIDLAGEDYDHNVRETKKVVEYARARGISIEAELGKIFEGHATPEEIATGYTDPDVARNFVEETGVDCLAVSIGTVHGFYAHGPNINFDLLEELISEVPCPIVVHGGSYLSDDDILRMVKLGVGKLNIGWEFFDAYRETLKSELNKEGCEIVAAMGAARDAVQAVALKKIDLLTAYRK